MKHLDLFSGIGGFALAAQRVGWETVGFCEIDPYCQKVLRKHWPNVPIHEQIETHPHRRVPLSGPYARARKRHRPASRGTDIDWALAWEVVEDAADLINDQLGVPVTRSIEEDCD